MKELRKQLLILLIFSAMSNLIYGQKAELLADINQGEKSSIVGKRANTIITFNDFLIFSAFSNNHGLEPWIFNGDTTFMLKDINPGLKSSDAQNYFLINDKVIFTAYNNDYGGEWWETDGTPEGTKIIADIFEGIGDGVLINSYQAYHQVENIIYFSGQNQEYNNELWKTDGTIEGTTLVKNIAPDNENSNIPSFPSNFVTFKNEVYFRAADKLWKTNGTEEGTQLIFDMPFNEIVVMKNHLLLMSENNLWVSDGTGDGTYLLKESQSLYNWDRKAISVLDDIALFSIRDLEHGAELWKTDGTKEGTKLVIDLWDGIQGSEPRNKVVLNNTLYYVGNDGKLGSSLYRSNGTVEGTKLVKDFIEDSSLDPFSNIDPLYSDGELIYMSAASVGFKQELWISDGTSEGTREVIFNQSGIFNPNNFYRFKDKLFVFALAENIGFEPYLIDLNAITTPIAELTNEKIVNVFPNPSTGTINIQSSSKSQRFTFFDLTGKFIESRGNVTQLDISGYKNGIYILEILDYKTNYRSIKKIVLSR